MGSQLFKTVPDHCVLFELLDSVCDKNERHFVVNEYTFRKLLRQETYDAFYESLRKHYHKSKLFYLDKQRQYAGFLTILRQLCQVFSVPYASRIINTHSTYSKTLHIYVQRDNWQTLPSPTQLCIVRTNKAPITNDNEDVIHASASF